MLVCGLCTVQQPRCPASLQRWFKTMVSSPGSHCSAPASEVVPRGGSGVRSPTEGSQEPRTLTGLLVFCKNPQLTFTGTFRKQSVGQGQREVVATARREDRNLSRFICNGLNLYGSERTKSNGAVVAENWGMGWEMGWNGGNFIMGLKPYNMF